MNRFMQCRDAIVKFLILNRLDFTVESYTVNVTRDSMVREVPREHIMDSETFWLTQLNEVLKPIGACVQWGVRTDEYIGMEVFEK